jgi:hypothetical protein
VGFLFNRNRSRLERQPKADKTMNILKKKVATRFAPETRFPVTPVPAPPFKATESSDFEKLKDLLLAQALAETNNTHLYAPLRRAANDAAALAWTAGYPLLLLPLLFEEKVIAARLHTAKQQTVQARSQSLMEAA